MDNKYKAILTLTPFAYGGIHDNIDIAENTIESITNALKEGMSLALDVRICQDGSIILFRDKNTHRMTNNSHRVINTRFSQLSNMTLYATGGKIMLLQDALELISDKVPLMLIVHEDGDVNHFMNCLTAIMDGYTGRYCMASTSNKILEWLIANRSEILRGSVAEYKRNFLPFIGRLKINIKQALATKPQFLCCEVTALPNKKVLRYFTENPNAILFSWRVVSDELYDKARTLSHNLVYHNITLKLKAEND